MHFPRLKLLVGGWHLLKQKMAFGNPTAGGFETMAEALWAVGQLNKELQNNKRKPDLQLAVSAHWWHELQVPSDEPEIGYSAQWNNPRAINFKQWLNGAKLGQYAPIGRIIPPGFGLPGSDDGFFINPDPIRRKLAHDMMIYSFKISDLVISWEAGEGDVIFWTGPDGLRWRRLTEGKDVRLGHNLNPDLEEWVLIVGSLGQAAFDARQQGWIKTKLLLEGKPAGDPCYLEVFTDTILEIKGIKAINRLAGAEVAEWQGEFCHSRGSGQTFASAMQQAIDGGVFGGRIHLNSGGLGPVNFTKLLLHLEGTWMSKFPQYVDNDFLPGEGVAEWLEDQVNTIQLGAKWSAETGKPFEVEFDARFCRYADTIGALRKSAEWTIRMFDDAARELRKSSALTP